MIAFKIKAVHLYEESWPVGSLVSTNDKGTQY